MSARVIKHAALDALGTAAYIALVSAFMFNVERIFATNEPDTVFAPILMLSLLVFSAAVTGFLVFGRPVLWYLDGRKKEALSLFAWTLGIFFALTLVAFLVQVGF